MATRRVAVTEFTAAPAKVLRWVRGGDIVVVTSRGEVVAKMVPGDFDLATFIPPSRPLVVPDKPPLKFVGEGPPMEWYIKNR